MDTDTVIKEIGPGIRLVAHVIAQEGREELLNTRGFKRFTDSSTYLEKIVDITFEEAIEYAKSLKSVAGVINVSVTVPGYVGADFPEQRPVMPDPPYTGEG